MPRMGLTSAPPTCGCPLAPGSVLPVLTWARSDRYTHRRLPELALPLVFNSMMLFVRHLSHVVSAAVLELLVVSASILRDPVLGQLLLTLNTFLPLSLRPILGAHCYQKKLHA